VIADGGSRGVMVALAVATLDPARAGVRAEARRLADRLSVDVAGDSEVAVALRSMLDNVAQGERVVVLRDDEEVTPGQAAQLLGVTRQFVDRLLADVVVEFHRLPDSPHRRIRLVTTERSAPVRSVSPERGDAGDRPAGARPRLCGPA